MTTTLVLGAGASTLMNYPTGAELRAEIIRLVRPEQLAFTVSAGLRRNQGELDRFVLAFAHSQMYSIDAFLARRPEHVDIGKRVIAACLLMREGESNLFLSEPIGHWYRYLFNALCRDSVDNVSLSKVSVITFNYDRSLEAYLHGSIKATFSVSSEVAANTVREMTINHVYGCLGSPIPSEPSYLKYGDGLSPALVDRAASGIKVIPEGRDEDEALAQARTALENASAIVFLGFGFDADNLRRLDTGRTCQRMRKSAEAVRMRSVFATCRGMTRMESMRAFDAIGQLLQPHQAAEPLPPGFFDDDCLRLLRETLVLYR